MANDMYELIPKTRKAFETHESNDDKDYKSPTRVTGKHNISYVRQLWGWATSLFDAKPYEVRESWGNTVWHLFKRLLTLSILMGTITLGVIQQSFDITSRNIWQRFQVNEDAQLAVFGLLNTLLALMIRDSLSHITDTIITKWMISKHGASPLDFEMYDESIKPWVAISNVHARRKQRGWSIRDGFRFTICAVTGICLLLQGASINTIGMPKLRWWPDTRFMKLDTEDERLFIKTRTLRVANVSYMSLWERGFHTIKQGGDVSWGVAHAIGAMSTIGAFENIYDTFNQSAGWTFASKQGALVRNAVKVTNTSTLSIQSISIHGGAIVSIWDEQRKTSNFAGIRRARGWEAWLKLNGILLDTKCYGTSKHPVGLWQASDHGNGTVSVKLGPATELDEVFPGATCLITISQALIEIIQWIVLDKIDRDRPDYSINNYEKNRYPDIKPLPASANNKYIAKQLSDWFNAVLPNLQTLSSSGNVSNFTSLAVRLSSVIVELNRGHTTLDGLSVVLSIIFSNFLTTFSWTFEEVSGNTTKHGPVRWQIYGSGPRLPWQWVSAAVIVVSIIVQLVDIFYVLWHRKTKGNWLSLGGMLVAANAAKRMASVTKDQGAGFLTEEGKFVKYFLRQKRDGDGSAKATLIDEIQLGDENVQYEKLKKGERYG